MLKLRVVQPGSAPVVHEFAGDEAVVGRAPECDVVVPEGYVSKRHTKILAGLVLVDLGSSNGTFVDGSAIGEPVLLTDSSFRLGSEPTDAVIEVEHIGGLAGTAELLEVRRELDAERRRSASMIKELDALRRRPPTPKAEGVDPRFVEQLRTELKSALQRIESLKAEVQERDLSASEGVQVRLAQDALAATQARNERLSAEIEQLRATGGGAGAEAARRALADRVAELEQERARLKASVAGLESRLEAAEAASQPAGGMSDLFFKLQADNQSLRQELEAAKAGRAQSEEGDGASGLFFELQAENARLRRELDERGAVSESVPAAPESWSGDATEELARLQQENHALELSKADLIGELDVLRTKLIDKTIVHVPTPGSASAGQGLDATFRALVDEDEEGMPPLLDGDAGGFVAVELFRFVRKVERFVTRMTGNFHQLYSQGTMLPDVKGNLRRLIGAVFEEAGSAESRRSLLDYIDELRKWLVVAVGANKQAAERFAEELRSDLSERGLTADEPMPALKKLTGGVDAELWRRASDYLKRLTSDVIEERLRRLAGRCADELRRDQDRC